MKKTFILSVCFIGAMSLASCSMEFKGRSAGNDYCDCKKAGDILDIAKCKKDVLKEHKESMKDKEFKNAFWESASNCE